MQEKTIYNQIKLLVNKNRLDEAERLLDQIKSTEPLFYVACFQRGYIRQLQGRLNDAKSLFLESLSIKPDFQQAGKCLTNLNKLIISKQNFVTNSDALYVYWYNEINNWGDTLNEILIEKLSGKKIIWVAPFDYRVPVKYLVIGSIAVNMDANSIIWGSGVMNEATNFTVKPKQICAVRGPLTRQVLINRGIDCPEIYGDPALLYPWLYNPVVEQKYDIGIIAHFIDKQHPWLKYAESKGAKIIDIQGEINKVVDDIKSCSRIASSSLHGIIAADAYGIPSTWIEFSDGVIGKGFKFRDYYQSVNRPTQNPVRINKETSIEQLDEGFYINGIDIDLELLLNSCPFTNNNAINNIE